MPQYDYLYLIHAPEITTSSGAMCQGGSQYSDLEINMGYAPTIKPYNLNDRFGLHIVINTAFTTSTAYMVYVVTSAAATALYGANLASPGQRTFTVAQFAVIGAHYYIPVQVAQLLQYFRAYWLLAGSNAGAGTCTMWFGPDTDGGI